MSIGLSRIACGSWYPVCLAPSALALPRARYELIEPLGKGTRAEVFKALRDDGSYVAVKRMFTLEQLKKEGWRNQEGCFDSRGVSVEAEREYLNSQLLDHPYIVHVFDTYEALDSEGVLRSHVVMDLVDGVPLNAIPNGSISKMQSLHNVRTVLSALAYAYQQGLAHLDLHGNNVMLDSRHEVTLIDLGSFVSVDSQSQGPQTLAERLNDVLELCDVIIRTGDWAIGEALGISQGLASLVQDPEAIQYSQIYLSKESVWLVPDCLHQIDQVLASFEQRVPRDWVKV